MSLSEQQDDTLERLQAEIEAAKKEQEEAKEEQEEEEKRLTSYDILALLGGPSKEEIEAYKAQNATELHILPLSEKEVYIYRPIKRAEWIQLQNMFAQAGNKIDSNKQEEYLVNKCLVWPKQQLGWEQMSKGGLISSLANAIMYSSYFLPTNLITAIVDKL